MSRIVLFTTPTSGTGSLWRIVQTFLPKDIPRISFIDDCLNRGIAINDIKKEVFPKHGCFLFNQPHLFNFNQDFSETQFVLNFRDPRDMSCNQYYWVFSHPNPSMTDEALAAHRDRIRTAGIDNFVLNQDHRSFFENHILFSSNPELMSKALVNSYIQLCFNTNGIIDRVAQTLGCTDIGLIERTKLAEHPSALAGANKWVGQKWEGADLFPGRARVELKGETFAKLTARYARALAALQSMDDSRYGFFYEA
jgi:hypothetical protein